MEEDRPLPYVDNRVEVWTNDEKYHAGHVVAHESSDLIKVRYDDGGLKILDLRKERSRANLSNGRERKRRHSDEPLLKQVSAAACAKFSAGSSSVSSASARPPLAHNTLTSNSFHGCCGKHSSTKRVRNEFESMEKSAGNTYQGKEKSHGTTETQAEDPIQGSNEMTSGGGGGGSVALNVSVMSSRLDAKSAEWRKRRSSQQRRLTVVEMKHAEATTEISDQLAALSDDEPTQATKFGHGIRDIIHEMARAVLRCDNVNQLNK